RHTRRGSGFALTATISKKSKRKTDDGPERPEGLTRADRQQDFLAEGVFELAKLQLSFTLVAQDFEHRRTAFLGHFHAPVVDAYHVHLQRFDLKVPVIAAIRTSQRHV